MRRVILTLAVALLGAAEQPAQAPELQTVANCMTDSECENGPDLENPFGDD